MNTKARRHLVAFLLTASLFCLYVAAVRSQHFRPRRITTTPEHTSNLNPTISGDGRRIAFESTADPGGTHDGRATGFHTLRVDLSNERPAFTEVAASRAPAPALSRDGSRLAFASRENLTGENSDGNSEIFLFADGALQQLTDTTPRDPAERARDGSFQPSISDDGALVAFASNRDLAGANSDANFEIFLYDLSTGRFAQLTDTTHAYNSTDAKLCGDGSRVAFIREAQTPGDDASNRRDLMLYERATNSARAVAADVAGLSLTYGRAITTDGRRVVYSAQTAARATQVLLYDGRNERTRQLTALGSRASDVPLHPTISGDGSRIAFATRRNVTGGNTDASVELYLYDLPEDKFTRITDAPSGATADIVSSLNEDGSLVAFNFPRVLDATVSAPEFVNNSEIYLASLEARAPASSELRVLHGASFGREAAAVKAIAPDQIAILRGVNLALEAVRSRPQTDGRFPQTLGGASVNVNGRPAQLFYASPTQINFHVPAETETGTAHVVARNHDGRESHTTVAVVRAAPGLFTEGGEGTGAAVALDAETLLRSPFDPVDTDNRARRLIIYATGVRRAEALSVSAGGHALAVEHVLASPDLPGLDEIHVLLTHALAGAGTVPLVVRADGRDSNTAEIDFKGTRRAASITLAPTQAAISVGRSVRFKATVRDFDGNEIADAPVRFDSSDANVATVDASGVAHGLRAGTTTITAASGEVSARAHLTVFPLIVVINEVLADPPDGADGDANRDGTRSSAQDEFVELVNASTIDLKLGGYQLTTRNSSGASLVRHVFTNDTILSPGASIVIFGGAQAGAFNPAHPAFGGAQVTTASTGGLSLANGGSVVKLLDSSGAVVEQLTYGDVGEPDGDRNQSLTRAPDITGDFTLHETAPGSLGRLFSPGTRLDAQAFDITVPIARIEVTPAAAQVERGAEQQFTARALDANGVEIQGVVFRWRTSDASVATIDASGLARASAVGETRITAAARGVESLPATIEVLLPRPKIARVEVAPSTAVVNRGGALQFNAQAFDPEGRLVSDTEFSWSSGDRLIASVDAAGLSRGLGIGTAFIAASTPDGAGGTVVGRASIEVRVPLVFNEILADVPPDAANTDAVEGDANRDGVRSSDDDEFVEILNSSHAPVDISGIVLTDATAARHTFPAGTSLAAGSSIVVFGGGSPPFDEPAFGGSNIRTAASLGLNDAGDTVSLKLRLGDAEFLIASQSYGTATEGTEGASTPPAPADASLTRAPDASADSAGGRFVAHTLAVNSAGRSYSPGTRADGTPFNSPPLTRITVEPPEAAIEIGASQNFRARGYAKFEGMEREVSQVSFVWDSSATDSVTVAPVSGAETTARAASHGKALIRARAGGLEATATLTVNSPPPPRITRIEIAPPSTTIGVGATQQFVARAFDENGREMTGVVFNWTTSNATVASINSDGLATGRGAGTTEVRASSANVTSAPASLNVTAPAAPEAGQVVINEALVAFASSSTQARRDFVELYNTTGQTLDITGLVIAFRPSGASNTPQTLTLTRASGEPFLIQPHSYFLIAGGADTFGVAADFNAGDGLFDLNNTTGAIKIELNGVKLDGLAYQGGSTSPAAVFNAYGEGATLTFTSGTTNDLIRSPNAADTNNNATDFRRNGTLSSVTPKAANP
ncbi:MAG TPA: lamin tail domain-containing protein [Pyrinomonadaceae bacterium]|nr:lamin tail domain-containing protein [Pyrinomonadaceae bacterium]